MIKQTSGAISFLLSAYRAILHKNFLLGLALASVTAVPTAHASFVEITSDATYKGGGNGTTSQLVTTMTDIFGGNGQNDNNFINKAVITATDNKALEMNDGFNYGTIVVTNGSSVNSNVVTNYGTIKVNNSSFWHDDIANFGTVEMKGTKDAPVYFFESSNMVNELGTLTLDHVQLVGMKKTDNYQAAEISGVDGYKAFTVSKGGSDCIQKLIYGNLYGSDYNPDDSTFMLGVKGGTVNITNSVFGESSLSAVADDYHGSDDEKEAIETFKLDQRIFKQFETKQGEPTYNELMVKGGTLNITNSTICANYVTNDGGVINVTDSNLTSYNNGEFNFNAGTVNIIAKDKDSIVGYNANSSVNGEKSGTIITVKSGATVNFKGEENGSHKAIMNAKKLTNAGTFNFLNENYEINSPDSSFELENGGKMTIAAAGANTLSQVAITNTTGGTLTISTGDSEISVNSFNVDGGTVNATNSSLNTGSEDISVKSGSAALGTVTTTGNMTATNKGTVTADKTTIKDLTITGGASVTTETLTSSGTIHVGTETNGTGTLNVENLISGKIVVDPQWNEATAISQVNFFNGGSTTVENIEVARNSAFGFGTKGTTVLTNFLSAIGGLSENGWTALLYLNKAITLNTAYGITVDGSQESVTTEANTLTLGKNSLLVLGESVVSDALLTDTDDDGTINDNSGTAAVTAGTVKYTNSSKVMLDSSNIKVDGQYRIFSTGTTLTNTTENGNYTDSGTVSALNVSSRNGVFTATVTESGITSAIVANYTPEYMSNMSSAVYATADAAATDNSSGTGVSFLTTVLGESENAGLEAEQAARLAQFGGVYQNAVLTSKVMDEAVNSRLGVGNVKSAFIYADNTQDYGVWMTPVYKTQSSSSYASDGFGYGVKAKLGGITIGADTTFAQKQIRAGVVFTLGKADVSGRGQASGVDNNADFYGAGIYGGYYKDAFSLSANIGMTHVSNNVKTETDFTSYGTLSSDVDADVFHVGVTGQYEFETAYLTVTPHAGVYFANVDVEGYDVNSNAGTIATTDNENLTVISFPVGVTLSHEFRASENVRLKPAADLRVTFNAGDTDIAYTTLFTGASTATNLKADVMDDVTYGIDLGVAASYKETFSFGLGVNYTGSSHADEIGATAHARYAF